MFLAVSVDTCYTDAQQNVNCFQDRGSGSFPVADATLVSLV
jgi:hypothetical protein